MKAASRCGTRPERRWLVLAGLAAVWLGGCTDGEVVVTQPPAAAPSTAGGADSRGLTRRPKTGPGPKRPSAGADDVRDDHVHRTEHVVLISVDGLAPRYLRAALDEGKLPAFERLAGLGGMTMNARTDVDFTYTLPNHTCMLTGLPVVAPSSDPAQGHGYTNNGDVANDVTLHNSGNPARDYTPSVFDVAHDRGLKTAMFASKTKFSLYANSYNTFGAEDRVGVDNGNEKIDVVRIDADLASMTDALLLELTSDPPALTFVHYNQPDATGHSLGWGSDEYMQVLPRVDQQLSRILDAVAVTPRLAGRTAVIVTTDHGGTGFGHGDASDALNFVIPFFVMAPGVPANSDLYSLAAPAFMAPSEQNPATLDPHPPIRNGHSGNLALELLGLAPIEGSLLHSLGRALFAAEPTGG